MFPLTSYFYSFVEMNLRHVECFSNVMSWRLCGLTQTWKARKNKARSKNPKNG